MRPLEFSFAVDGAAAGRRGRWPAATDTTCCSATATGDEVGGRPDDGFGIDLKLTARKPAALHDGDGWIDFGPAGGSYYVLADRHGGHGDGHAGRRDARRRGRRLVRPPVGRLHLGRRRRLGLVRRQPRRRHGPHAVARPGGRRHLPAGLRHARRRRRGHDEPRRRRLLGRGHRPLDEPDNGATVPRRLADPHPLCRTWRSTSARRSPSRSWTRARRRASCTGRARRSCRRPATADPSAARPTSS